MSANTQPASLEERLKRLIALQGPISVASYMAQCLSDPEQGYYTTGTPLGAEGDFTTAPEISQMFGELIGIWFLSAWQQSGSPTPFRLVELGPGRGTLMADMVRAIRSNPQAAEALEIHLVEISPSLSEQQEKTLSSLNLTPIWHPSIDTLPQAPLFLVANEFFDALPIHQWVFHQGKWHERVVGLAKEETGEGKLAFGIGSVRHLATEGSPQEGAIWEQCPIAEAITATLAKHLAHHGGATLVIDYGFDKLAYGDTFQALRSHRYADPLANPGEQDLTAHVNFANLARAARNQLKQANSSQIAISETITQGNFLLAMGLLQRAGRLGANKNPDEQEAIRDAVERLAAPEQMGDLFKVLAFHHRDIQPPGFSQLT